MCPEGSWFFWADHPSTARQARISPATKTGRLSAETAMTRQIRAYVAVFAQEPPILPGVRGEARLAGLEI
jgi:hypothetical protein